MTCNTRKDKSHLITNKPLTKSKKAKRKKINNKQQQTLDRQPRHESEQTTQTHEHTNTRAIPKI